MTSNQPSPFGTGDENNPFGAPSSGGQDESSAEFTGVGNHDYRFGGYQSGGGKNSARIEVPVWRAPWSLLGSAVLAVLAAGDLVYQVANRWLLGRDVGTPEIVLVTIAVVLAVVGAVLALRSYRSGRVILLIWAILCLVLLLHSTLWVVSLLAVAAAVLAWLPPSRRWTDY